MADDPNTPRADDQYARYYAEKLWALVPSVYRHEDGATERPGALRAFIELIAEQAALLRRSHDRLWDDAFIELCDDWAVPYLGDLVGTRMLSALNRRGRRVDVAKTIYYRRRKGTPRVLEELIADITGWEGKAVESFRFLGRTRHHLDPALPDLLEPAPGWADLRDPRLTERAGGPWDPFAHTPDLRKSRGRDGRWNIPVLTLHLFRLAAFPLTGVTPFARADGDSFAFDPSGRDTPLFMPRRRLGGYAWDDWRSARPWEVPAPMGCRTLGHAEYEIDEELRQAMLLAGTSAPAVAELAPLVGARLPSETALREALSVMNNAAELLAAGNYDRLRVGALIADCGKFALWPEAVEVAPTAGNPVPRERVAASNLDGAPPVAFEIDLQVDPVRGRFVPRVAPPEPADVRVRYWHGFGAQIGAGGYDRRATVIDVPDVVVPPAAISGGAITAAHYPIDPDTGDVSGVVEIPDSATYSVQASPSDVSRLVVQAANLARPYLTLDGDWEFTAAPDLEAELVLEGLWIGARVAAAIVLRGAWQRVAIRHTTLDPGGADSDGAALSAIPIWIEGQVDELRVTASVVARIGTRLDGAVDTVVIEDSIVGASPGAVGGGPAVALPAGALQLRRVTALGVVDVERLDASEALITGNVDVTDTQVGCFRFSSAPPGSRLPRPYRWVPWPGGPVFTSTRFGDPGYGWLSESAPEALRRGAENGGEIGAFSAALNPIKEDGLVRKVQEYMPFGLIPILVRET